MPEDDPAAKASPQLYPKASVPDLVADGMLLALAGVRMTVKNLIIVRALRDGAQFDEDWYISAVQHELLVMAAEKDTDAARVEATEVAASSLRGVATHHSDFRRADRRQLARRAKVLRALSAELVRASENSDAATAIVHQARDSALDDIAGAIPPTGDTEVLTEDGLPDDPVDHLHRLALLGEDLRALEKRSRHPRRGRR